MIILEKYIASEFIYIETRKDQCIRQAISYKGKEKIIYGINYDPCHDCENFIKAANTWSDSMKSLTLERASLLKSLYYILGKK